MSTYRREQTCSAPDWMFYSRGGELTAFLGHFGPGFRVRRFQRRCRSRLRRRVLKDDLRYTVHLLQTCCHLRHPAESNYWYQTRLHPERQAPRGAMIDQSPRRHALLLRLFSVRHLDQNSQCGIGGRLWWRKAKRAAVSDRQTISTQTLSTNFRAGDIVSMDGHPRAVRPSSSRSRSSRTHTRSPRR